MPKKTFTKYPQGYVKADTQYKDLTDEEFNQIVDSYKKQGQGSRYTSWSLIVAELKGTYGLDVAKEIADAVCYGESSTVTASTLDDINWGDIDGELNNARLTIDNFLSGSNMDIIWDTYAKASNSNDQSKLRQMYQATKQFNQALTEAINIYNKQIQGIDQGLYTEIGYAIGEDEQYRRLGE